MVLKSIGDCLNTIDDVIFDNCSKNHIKSNLEDIRKYIELKHCTIRKENNIEVVSVLSLLYLINKIIEKLYSDDTEENFNEDYNHLRHNFLEWYQAIDEN